GGAGGFGSPVRAGCAGGVGTGTGFCPSVSARVAMLPAVSNGTTRAMIRTRMGRASLPTGTESQRGPGVPAELVSFTLCARVGSSRGLLGLGRFLRRLLLLGRRFLARQQNGADPHGRVRLRVALEAAVVLPAAVLLNGVLDRGVLDDLGNDPRALDDRLPDLRVLPRLEQQHAR